MKLRLAILLLTIGLCYFIYLPLTEGILFNQLFNIYMLLPYFLCLTGLFIFTYGVRQFVLLLSSFRILISNEMITTTIKGYVIDCTIIYSYSTAAIWIIFTIAISNAYLISDRLLMSEISKGFLCALITAELLLRPLKKRIQHLECTKIKS